MTLVGVRRVWTRVREEFDRGGLPRVITETARTLAGYARYALVARHRSLPPFPYLDRELAPVVHPYNQTWANERCVELAIARAFLDEHPGRMLEVGNVLAHYGHRGHDVVDRYERSPGVTNVDVLEWQPDHRYDAIIAISTLEHVGWDELPQDPQKAVAALDHLLGLLRPGGSMLVTIPIGHHPKLETAIAEGAYKPSSTVYLARSSSGGWDTVARKEATLRPYDRRKRRAAAIMITSWHRP